MRISSSSFICSYCLLLPPTDSHILLHIHVHVALYCALDGLKVGVVDHEVDVAELWVLAVLWVVAERWIGVVLHEVAPEEFPSLSDLPVCWFRKRLRASPIRKLIHSVWNLHRTAQVETELSRWPRGSCDLVNPDHSCRSRHSMYARTFGSRLCDGAG